MIMSLKIEKAPDREPWSGAMTHVRSGGGSQGLGGTAPNARLVSAEPVNWPWTYVARGQRRELDALIELSDEVCGTAERCRRTGWSARARRGYVWRKALFVV